MRQTRINPGFLILGKRVLAEIQNPVTAQAHESFEKFAAVAPFLLIDTISKLRQLPENQNNAIAAGCRIPVNLTVFVLNDYWLQGVSFFQQLRNLELTAEHRFNRLANFFEQLTLTGRTRFK